MNKKIYFIGAVLLLSFAFLSSCKKEKKKGTSTSEAREVTTEAGGAAYAVDPEKSVIYWIGDKPVGESHNGRIPVSTGEVYMDANRILSGSFEFDLNNIICDNLEGEMNKMLVAHLKNEDFFDVAKFPKGEFTITSTEILSESPDSCLISGNLKLKDIEKNISFKAQITESENGFTAKTGIFQFDRTDFGVNYHSKNFIKNIKDSIINDEVTVSIEIIVKKKN